MFNFKDDSKPKLSIIVSFGLSKEREFIAQRIENKARFYQSDERIEFIFIEGFSSAENKDLKELIIKQGHRYFRDEKQFLNKAFSLAQCRNFGALQANAKVILFLDADCFLSLSTLKKLLDLSLAKDIAGNENEFLMLPCLYLNKEASEFFSTQEPILWDVLAQSDLARAQRKYVQNFARASSLVLFNKAKFEALGGYDESFIGHGYEDFEFLLRFLQETSEFECLPRDLCFDSRSWEFSEFKGFRALFSLLGLEGVSYGLYALHFWHTNPNQNGYLDNREKNHVQFYERLKVFEKQQNALKSLNFNKKNLDQNKQSLKAKTQYARKKITLNAVFYLPYKFEITYKNSLSNHLLRQVDEKLFGSFFSKIHTKISHTKFYRLFVKFKNSPKFFFKESKLFKLFKK